MLLQLAQSSKKYSSVDSLSFMEPVPVYPKRVGYFSPYNANLASIIVALQTSLKDHNPNSLSGDFKPLRSSFPSKLK